MPNIDEKIIWPGWETMQLIGHGSFGAVYEIERDVLGDKEKAALKVISIPQSDSDISEMYSDGYDDESITSTFKEHLKSIVAEYSLMRKLNGSANVVNCDDVRYVQHDDGFGWDIFIKMELLTPLTAALPADVSEDQIIKIAKDLCRALVQCRQFGIVHRDIKPQNIFVSPLGDYKLGDFGIAKTVEKTSGGTKIGTYKYMAPEVYNNQPYGAGADIYSLGLVLYWLLNERRMPFLPLPPEKLRAGLEEEARLRRFRGEPIPAPAHGSEELKRIVLKACAYDPKDRYQSAEEVLRELEAVGAPAYSIPSSKIAAGYEDACLDQSGRAENDEDSTVSAMHLDDTVPDENETIDIFHMDCPAREIVKQDICAVSEKETEEQSEDATVSAYGTQKEKSIEPDDKTVSAFTEKPSQKIEPVPQKAKKLIGTVIAAIAALAAIIAVFIWAPWENQAGTSTGIGGSVANDSVLPTTPVVSETPMSSEASAETPEVEPIYAEIADAKVGNIVSFGTFELDGNTADGEEDLQWIVLAIDNNQMLLTTRFAVASMPYSTKLSTYQGYNDLVGTFNYEACTWENSTLRQWLNNEFINAAFDSKERDAIVNVTNTNYEHGGDYNEYIKEAGPETNDKVFLLSEEEVNPYFKEKKTGALLVPQSLIDDGVQYNKSTGTIRWWTRTLLFTPGTGAMAVSVYGKVGSSYSVDEYELGVRPTIVIDITKVE